MHAMKLQVLEVFLHLQWVFRFHIDLYNENKNKQKMYFCALNTYNPEGWEGSNQHVLLSCCRRRFFWSFDYSPATCHFMQLL